MKTRKLVITALFAALTCVATLVIQIPSGMGGGYVNLGDGMVLISAYILGPLFGGVAAGVGSCIADIASGYAAFALPTLIIKFIMAVASGRLFVMLKKKNKISILIACGIAGQFIMTMGYFLTEIWLSGSVAVAAAGIYGSLVQSVFGLAASTVLYKALCSNTMLNNYINKI